MRFYKTLLEKSSFESFSSDSPTAHVQVSPFHRGIRMHTIPSKFSCWDGSTGPLHHSSDSFAAWLQGTMLLPAVTQHNSAMHVGCYMYRGSSGMGRGFMTFLEFLPKSFFLKCFKEETGFYWGNLTPFSLELKLWTPFTSPWRRGKGLEASNSLGPMRNHKKSLMFSGWYFCHPGPTLAMILRCMTLKGTKFVQLLPVLLLYFLLCWSRRYFVGPV